jgi:hypothetical protein
MAKSAGERYRTLFPLSPDLCLRGRPMTGADTPGSCWRAVAFLRAGFAGLRAIAATCESNQRLMFLTGSRDEYGIINCYETSILRNLRARYYHWQLRLYHDTQSARFSIGSFRPFRAGRSSKLIILIRQDLLTFGLTIGTSNIRQRSLPET